MRQSTVRTAATAGFRLSLWCAALRDGLLTKFSGASLVAVSVWVCCFALDSTHTMFCTLSYYSACICQVGDLLHFTIRDLDTIFGDMQLDVHTLRPAERAERTLQELERAKVCGTRV